MSVLAALQFCVALSFCALTMKVLCNKDASAKVLHHHHHNNNKQSHPLLLCVMMLVFGFTVCAGATRSDATHTR